ncbi:MULTISPECIES: sterol desaturase family protein [Halocynthiibacter]|uniref:Sterol desaturase family protein n=1 Tax=Halocynthiibacter halioticoli TaxID=2986804 RepID=A0AAE3LSE9_9RHOB|nr:MULTISPECIES: sterol desaturase family protein [Halocynthiibacter]MCV6825494.1 sterol desaturase family protein [Halocynthiibacter halioticoli]MCW4058495.1 sterol desaturase family protein [Halocynthiibacter sp. SDUM655004]
MNSETTLRLAVFLGLFACFAAVEVFWPRRKGGQKRKQRWFVNWSIVLLDTVTLRLMSVIVPLLAVGAAIDAQARGVGLLNSTEWPAAIEFIVAILVFDLAIWFQHLLMHRIPILWRLHQVHHVDEEMDVTTAIRFHPIEIALSMLLKIGLVYVLGPSAIAVVAFEVLLNGTALFNHANIKLPVGVDRIVRLVLVTPDMHRVHHSIHPKEHHRNFGFSLSIWDKVFGTYLAQPAEPHETMPIGLSYDQQTPKTLGAALSMPFREPKP